MAMKAYKERESALQHYVQLNQASFQQQINERDEVIASLQKENEQNKLRIHQLERQLFEKEMLVMSYRGQLRDVSVKSEEYYRPISLQQQLHNNMTPPHLNINGRWSAGGGAFVSVLKSRGNDSAPIVID
ncbi:hypothetical protein SESBI_20329 [Sesbania bispinosa]|nr:hypothetical protein SESBI_20329 [Sesbania bispinosa]